MTTTTTTIHLDASSVDEARALTSSSDISVRYLPVLDREWLRVVVRFNKEPVADWGVMRTVAFVLTRIHLSKATFGVDRADFSRDVDPVASTALPIDLHRAPTMAFSLDQLKTLALQRIEQYTCPGAQCLIQTSAQRDADVVSFRVCASAMCRPSVPVPQKKLWLSGEMALMRYRLIHAPAPPSLQGAMEVALDDEAFMLLPLVRAGYPHLDLPTGAKGTLQCKSPLLLSSLVLAAAQSSLKRYLQEEAPRERSTSHAGIVQHVLPHVCIALGLERHRIVPPPVRSDRVVNMANMERVRDIEDLCSVMPACVRELKDQAFPRAGTVPQHHLRYAQRTLFTPFALGNGVPVETLKRAMYGDPNKARENEREIDNWVLTLERGKMPTMGCGSIQKAGGCPHFEQHKTQQKARVECQRQQNLLLLRTEWPTGLWFESPFDWTQQFLKARKIKIKDEAAPSTHRAGAVAGRKRAHPGDIRAYVA